MYGVPKVSTFTYHNKLTSRIVSKLLIGLTTLNQALICTPTPNLMGIIQSELMISQAFQACYSIEGCPSNCCVLSQDRIEYSAENIHQLNLLPRLSLCQGQNFRGQKNGVIGKSILWNGVMYYIGEE